VTTPRARRGALALGLALALLGPAAGCGDDTGGERRGLTLLGPWTGPEGEAFEALLAGFEAERGIPVDYQGTTATREVLLAGVQTGDPPDIAILPGLGELADYAARGVLHDLADGLLPEGAYGEPWLTRPTGAGDLRYWVPVKVDLKSIVWHEAGQDPARAAADPAQWCVGLLSDATTGWPASDWIEDILLQQSGAGDYNAWATGALPWTDEPVVTAWETWGAFLAQDPTGRAAREALHTDHRGRGDRQGLLLDRDHPCALEHQGSFLRSLYAPEDARRLDFTPSPRLLPGAAGASRDREVSADFAAMFRESGDAAELMRFLMAEETQTRRAGTPAWPAFSANAGVTPGVYPDEVSRRIARELRDADALCLDASDVMPPTIGRIFTEKLIEFLANPSQDPRPLLRQIQDVQDAQPRDTPWLEQVCG
jgi:alpha-glucoside transport system substrate-binding protein